MAHHTVQLFQSLREFYKIIGIHQLQLSHSSYNWRNAGASLFMTLSMLSSSAFLIYKAEHIRDYSASFYTFITELLHLGCFLSFRNNMRNVFVLMDELEAFIEKSELKLSSILFTNLVNGIRNRKLWMQNYRTNIFNRNVIHI